jgi:antitoxin YefM
MVKILPISEVKARLPDCTEYERLKETLDVLSDADLMRQIHRSLKEIAAGEKGLSFEDVFGEPLLPQRKKQGR